MASIAKPDTERGPRSRRTDITRVDRIRVGVHVSIAGGLHRAVEHARELGCETMQIFSKSPRGWAARPVDPEDSDRASRLRHDLGITPLAVHASYLINLAAADPLLYEKSLSALEEELRRSRIMGADFLVLHVGSVREGQRDGIQRVSRALKRVLRKAPSSPILLLENTAGERGEIGSRFSELGEILDRLGSERVGVCLDTCHLLAAGYDITSAAGVATVIQEVDREVGLSSVRLIHANDSKKGLGCHVDRHQHIGEGGIGRNGFRAVLAHPALHSIPMVLETPKTTEADDRRNLKTIRQLASLQLS